MSDGFVEMWTSQAQRVWDTIKRDGVYYVKEQYVREKYGDTAWIFQEAYRFFVRKASGIVEKPQEAESPVWMYCDKRWAAPEGDAVRVKLRIPREEVILFDARTWSRILNLSYVGSEEEVMRFEQKLKERGIMYASNVFEKPYYPDLKAEIIKSWDTLFSQGYPEPLYIQGAAWKIEIVWVQE